ncbi:alpha/beta hydrolase [Streptomyces sp. NPDC049040]|uniref:alpha/beta hydrolase n=1 Tax=Streptomyces sp. NPDC049040 TaxID=3365593 RepID=UPI0037171FC8
MGIVVVDPDMLDRLAESCEGKVRDDIPRALKRAEELSASDKVSGLAPLRSYLVDTARDLRAKSAGIRNPSADPFASLEAFGLPTGFDAGSPAAEQLGTDLSNLLAAHKDDSPAARAQAVKDWFATLTPLQQAELAEAEPGVVGNLDGVPPTVRFAANRIGIQQEYEKELAYFKTLQPDDPAYKRTSARVDTLRGFLNPREQRFRDPDTGQITTREIPRQFLVFDPAAGSVADPKATPYPDGRVAEVIGDLTTASNVAFRIPGITNRLDNFEGFGNGGYNLVQDQHTGVEQPETAVVSWLGYDTPEIGDSVDPSKAVAGGQALADFMAGISVDLKPDATKDVFAHSYGTLCTSKALQDGMHVDNVVFMGSPGLGPNINSVADFHMPGTRFYAMRAPKDLVSYTQGLGNDPADFPDITRLATDGSTGHSQYYNSSTGSLTNLQSILFGGSQHLTFTHTTLDDEMTGAAEVRELVSFLHSKVPPDVVTRMGSDLDPIVQDILAGRTSYIKALGPINKVLNRYNMLDRVTPKDLRDELVGLTGDLAYKKTYKAAKARNVPDVIARGLANTARFTARSAAFAVSLPVVKMLDLDRLQNNVRQLFGGVTHDAGRIADDGADAWNDLTSGDFTGVAQDTGDAVDAVTDAGKTVIDKGKNIVESTGDFLNPFD